VRAGSASERQRGSPYDFRLIEPQHYAHASKLINSVGTNLGGWINQQKAKAK